MPVAPGQTGGQKRKAYTNAHSSPADRKRQKTQNARNVPVQSRDAAISATGELDVASFVKAREYEINALEKSMQKSKGVLAQRAFQQVPRTMRRRTASHNVKKIPRRLRRRAAREMKEDNTPTVTARRRVPSAKQRLKLENARRLKSLNQHSKTVRQKKKEAKHNAAQTDPQNHISLTRVPKVKKNNLSEPPKATSKFKKRQTHKTWLPTHLWHSKRAHMSKPTEPLWRMAIPISPTEKSYRPSHRASGGRGCIAWDVSYMSTICCQGMEASLDSMLKSVGFQGEGWSGARYKRWKQGTRSATGWMFERDNIAQAIAPVQIVWCPEVPQTGVNKEASSTTEAAERAGDTRMTKAPIMPVQKQKQKRSNCRAFIRVHPSAFHELWVLLIKVAKIQRPQVMMQDLRFEIGSIEVTGPGSTEALLGVLKPADSSAASGMSSESVWSSLAGLTNPASLPQGALLHLNVCDPRLSHPPKQISIPDDEESANALTELLVSWPPDRTANIPDIFSDKSRHLAGKALPSQKAINRRKTLAPPGQVPLAKENDPRIPVMLLANRPPGGTSSAQGTWTVLLPWKCVDPVWRSLIYYPLSSGGTPRFGGLDQKRQISFEHGEAWFPGDFAATEAGQAWERTETATRFDHWCRRPPSRRVAWETVDLGSGKKGEHGRGWTCDWAFLLTGKASDPIGGLEGRTYEGADAAVRPIGAGDTQGEPKTQRQRKLAKATEARKSNMTTSDSEEQADDVPPVQPGLEKATETSASVPPDAEGSQHPTNKSETSLSFIHLTPSVAISMLKNFQSSTVPLLPSLVTIRITLLTRGTPVPCARIYRLPADTTPAGIALRSKWLHLDPTASDPTTKDADTRNRKPDRRIKKDKLNHRGDPKGHTAHPFENMDHMNYIPPNAPPEFFKTPEFLKAAEAQTAALAKEEPKDNRAALVRSLMTPDEHGVEHPPCPEVEDLIGFVTSGAYNLAEGRGTAIGSVWVQRLVEGWKAETPADARGGEKRMQRSRRLCVVRNAGEEVGRLGLWEVCD